jgi:glucosamine--fructose-6-phosphate aminotransferase (isomerizing)
MFREAAESARAVQTHLEKSAASIGQLSTKLRQLAPRAVVTCARGSSDHAATFAKYLIETRVGVLTSSAAPSISSLYEARTDLRDTLFLVISQSGASPDLLAAARDAKSAGALVVACVNAEESPLSQLADYCVPLCAGREVSVAATKSFIVSLAAVAHLVARWTGDDDLLAALALAPSQLQHAWQLDWSAAETRLRTATNLYVLARGLGLAVAQEAALKLKETCGLHAEALSAAEVLHGPMALVRSGFPVMLFAQNDETREGVENLAQQLAARGTDVLLAGAADHAADAGHANRREHTGNAVGADDDAAAGHLDASGAPRLAHLPIVRAHPAIEPMLMIQSFYRMANALSLARGFDPDCPPNLSKVTETV